MNNISLEVKEIESKPKSKKVTINEEKNIIREIPAEGNSNPLPKKQPTKIRQVKPVIKSDNPTYNNVRHPIRRMPFNNQRLMMGFMRPRSFMPMTFK